MPLRWLASREAFLFVLALAVGAVMSLISPYFLTVDNLLGMTQFGAVLALVALGQSLVILGGGAGIDLSIGSVLSLSGVVIGLLVRAGVNVWTAALVGVAVGAVLGLLNGLIVTRLGIPPLIVTLGTMYTWGAVPLIITRGVPISGFPEEFAFLGQGQILGIPAQVLLVVLPSFLVMHWVMTRTVFGRRVYLVGVNDVAAQLAGIDVRRVRIWLYTISGFKAGLGAVVMCSWLLSARPDVGNGYELQAITVGVLGGVHIFGGSGTLPGVMLAVLIVTMIASGLQLANVNTIWQLAVLGLILLVAVAGNQSISVREHRRCDIRA